jgi:4-hydroxythreonine-4-phosphate dehydrogenase
MAPPDLLIMADDLTGAADTGIFFADQGFATAIALREDRTQDEPPILVVDTDTRDTDAHTAQERVRAAVARHRGRTIFKKVDSTLRGHIAAELSVVVERHRGPVICAPAFPATGRITCAGVQFEGGRPLREGQAWAAERDQAPATVAAALTVLPTAAIGLAEVRGSGLPAALAATRGRVAICDAATDEDLLQIARAGLALAEPPVWVGSGGLAAALATVLATGAPPMPLVPVEGNALIVVGSATATARAQAQSLGGAAALLTLHTRDLCQTDAATLARLADVVSQRLQSQDTVVVVAGPVEPERRAQIVRGLAAVVAPAARAARLLALTGGQTARTVLTAAGARSLRLRRQVEAGVVLSEARWESGARSAVITKAGAFGDETTLLRAVRGVRMRREERQ